LIQSKRFILAAMLSLGIAFLVYSPVALAAESAPRVLGTVVALGHASMKAGLDRWLPVDEKTHPVIDGAALKTEEGTISITMKDGASIEVGKRTELLVGGTIGNYWIQLQTGTLAFKLYEGIGLSVTTPSTSVVVERSSGTVENIRHTVKEEISGIITHDGKDTQVICLRGKLGVMQAAVEKLILTEGDRVAVSPQTVTQTRVQGLTPQASGTSALPTAVVQAYENPKVLFPELVTTPLEQVQTGGLEVVSENVP
jgi:hypothetical protein